MNHPFVWNIAWVVTAVALLGGVGCDEVRVTDDDLRPVENVDRVVAAVNDPTVAVVDVRSAERYAAGHIPSAINIFLPDIRRGDPRLANAQRIIVYAGGWQDPLSSAAAKRMIALGYINVEDFRGGVRAWREAGHELVTEEEAGEDGDDAQAPPAGVERPAKRLAKHLPLLRVRAARLVTEDKQLDEQPAPGSR